VDILIHQRGEKKKVWNCFGIIVLTVLVFLGGSAILPIFLAIFARFWSWELLFSTVFATFWSSNLSDCPSRLQHFGAQTFHVAWYFATRVHLRLGYGCFQAYFGLVLGWFRIKKRRSREAEKSRKAEKKKA